LALDVLRFGRLFRRVSLQSQLNQNLWNFIILRKICIQHDVNLYFIPEKLTIKVDLMAINSTTSSLGYQPCTAWLISP
jgi:hypothetical protein